MNDLDKVRRAASERSSVDEVAVVGVVVPVRGSVIDMRFRGGLLAIYTLLHAGNDRQVALEVLAQRDAHHVRGIALQVAARDESPDLSGAVRKADIDTRGQPDA